MSLELDKTPKAFGNYLVRRGRGGTVVGGGEGRAHETDLKAKTRKKTFKWREEDL